MNKNKFGIITIITIVIALSILILSKTSILANLDLAYNGINEKNIETIIDDIESGENILIFDNTTRTDLNYFIDRIYDSPDLFWLSMRYTSISIGNVSILHIEDKYDSISDKKEFVETKLNEIIKSIVTDNMSNYEKTLKIHDWICDNITYGEIKNDGDQEIYGALSTYTARCAGYAKLFTCLLDKVGIESYVISGDAIDSNGDTIAHAWNLVNIDGKNYYFDITWNDHDTKNGTTYYWFAVKEDEFKNKHFPNDGYDWISDNNDEDNYYIKNNMYLSKYNYMNIVNQIQKQGKTFTIKCKNKEVLNQTMKALGNKDELQKIMRATGITYIEEIIYEEEPSVNCLKVTIK